MPGAAVAVAHDGRLAFVRAYGDVEPASRFQVASVSKPVAAYGILRLAHARGISLDAPVTTRGWRVPSRGITLRRLLSHTAGLDVGGYLGTDPGAPLPTLQASLRAVRLTHPPGMRWSYSGGGFSVAQLWAQEVSGKPFATLMRDTVLRPLGMSGASFEQTDRPADATPHDRAGHPIPAYRYAELAAAGLRATAADMARFAVAITPEMARAQPATGGTYGLGVELERLGDGTRVVEHLGSSRGWRSRVAAFPDRGWAIAVLTDGDGGEPVTDAAVGVLGG